MEPIDYEEPYELKTTNYDRNKIHQFANWIAWRVLICGAIYYCQIHHPTIAVISVIALIGTSF